MRVGGIAATAVTVLGPTSVRALTSGGTSGPNVVAVTTPSGTATLTNAFAYVVPAPTIILITPTSGSTAVRGGRSHGPTGSSDRDLPLVPRFKLELRGIRREIIDSGVRVANWSVELPRLPRRAQPVASRFIESMSGGRSNGSVRKNLSVSTMAVAVLMSPSRWCWSRPLVTPVCAAAFESASGRPHWTN